MLTAWLKVPSSGGGLILGVAIVGAVVVLAGTKLSKYADEIGDRLNLSKAWIGLLFLAVITSVPELVTCLGAVTMVGGRGGADMALGNLFGSNLFNLMIIAVLDVVQGRGPLLLHAGTGQILTAAGSMVLMGVATLGVTLNMLADEFTQQFGFLFAAALLVIYVILIRVTFRYERAAVAAASDEDGLTPTGSAARAYGGFAFCGALIILSGIVLIRFGDALAVHEWHLGGKTHTLGQTTVGTFLIAIITSLPELIVTLASFRLGSVDMALGNLFGSNMCNMAIAGIISFVNRGGSVFALCGGAHAITGILAMTITAVAVGGLIVRSKKSALYMGLDVIAMVILYVLGVIVIVSAGLGAGVS